jgi:hypothetical protein
MKTLIINVDALGELDIKDLISEIIASYEINEEDCRLVDGLVTVTAYPMPEKDITSCTGCLENCEIALSSCETCLPGFKNYHSK